MPTRTDRRDEQIGAFFAAHADRLQRAVRRRTHRVGDEVIEDTLIQPYPGHATRQSPQGARVAL